MAAIIHRPNLSEAWLASMEHLLLVGGKEINLITVIDSPSFEVLAVRQRLDEFISSRRSNQTWPVSTVANTIFPASLYLPRLGEGAQDHLYRVHKEGDRIRRRFNANKSGTYFDRLTAWPSDKGECNQLERTIRRLGKAANRNPLSSAYEIAVSTPEDDEYQAGDLRIYKPGIDNRTRGFPCLSHISLTSVKGVLHMTATYRNQHFISRAYGNYVGLSRLLGFLAHEAELNPGELVCMATHADAEIRQRRGFGKRAVQALVDSCREIFSDQQAAAVERPVLPALQLTHSLRTQ
ncbi:MAG: hypothetical protein QOF33_678 [Thermomicrobiales bacterium]|nr:hypothetical protein [Thermomicrobiales bacterium]